MNSVDTMSYVLNDIRAVLFDFDGTLVDSYPAITASVNHVRAAQGLGPLPEKEVRRHVGHGLLYLLAHTAPSGNPAVDADRYRAHHPTVLQSGTRLLPGAAETLAAVKASGRRTAVCSNKPRDFTRVLLGYLHLADVVDTLVGPEDVARPKPAPDMVLEALRRLGTPAAAALYVGDMSVDIETARAAGVRVWVVPTGSEERSALECARPDRLLPDLHALLALARS
jgi:phosphoglycolate phosphatase